MFTDSGLSRVGRWYVGLVVAAGFLLVGFSLVALVRGAIDLRWLAFAGLTVLSASAAIKVPALPAQISVSETFVFTSLLVFGPEAGILTVAIDGLIASLWIHRRRSYAVYKTLFNMTAPALALWLAWAASFGLARIAPLMQQTTPIERLLPPLFVLAVIYFALNSWLIAYAIALQTRVPPARVWRDNFLWIAINYLGGASVSVLLILLYRTAVLGTVALGIVVPLVTMFYLMFKIGMGRVEDSIVHLTAIKLAAEQRVALEEQLREANKMESVGRLAAGVAHDFNNLLGPILGYAELLIAEPDLEERHREDLRQIKHAAERARDLTGQLLAFGRKQVLQLERLDLRTVVESFGQLLRRTLRANVHLDIQQPPSLGLVRADPVQVEQILMNLVVNAQDAMPEGGTLSIIVGETVVNDASAAKDPGLPLGPCVTIGVRDTGVGMDAVTKARVCEPFFTTKGRGKGTGLGLATVYGIVKQHGGHLVVESAPGVGSSFTVYLPRAEQQDTEAAPVPASEAQPQMRAGSRGGTILVVEDDDAVGRVVRLVLERDGFRVAYAASGKEALDVARAAETSIDLLVTDIMLPDVSGVDLHLRIAGILPGVRAMYMSGYATDVLAGSGELVKGTRWLQKPFSPDQLRQAVREVLDATSGTAA